MAFQPVNANTIKALTTNVTDLFNTRLEANPPSPFFTRTVMETTSRNAYEEYAWMLTFAAMREWIGERQIVDNTILDTYLIRNRTFELTMKVLLQDIEDGVYAFKAAAEAEEMADAYQRRKQDLILDLFLSSFGAVADPSNDATWFQAGTAVLGPDGVPLFSENHPLGRMARVRANGTETYKFVMDGTFSNVTDLPFSEENLAAVRTLMRKQKDHYGRPARLNGNLLVVGPANEDAAIRAVGPTRVVKIVTDGDTETRTEGPNPLAGRYEVMVVDELGDSPAWFIFDTTRRAKPFIFQNRKAPVLQRTAPLQAGADAGTISDSLFFTNAIHYGITARMGAGIGHPLTAYGSTGDGS